MSDILILGAGGFIGRHLARRYAAAGADVIAATRVPATFDHPRIRNVVAPYDDASHFRPLLSCATAVIHGASTTTPGSTAAKPQLEGNLRTSLALVEALQDVPGCRLVFLSSAGTLYGDRDVPALEDDPLRPRSYHGAGRAATEHFLHAWATQYGGTAVILRPTNIFGPGQLPRRGFGVIPAAHHSRSGATEAPCATISTWMTSHCSVSRRPHIRCRRVHAPSTPRAAMRSRWTRSSTGSMR